MKKKIKVAISGGFDPIHVGHIRLINEAKKLGEELIVIINNDNWLKNKKKYNFMNQKDRAEIIKNIKAVDKIAITKHTKNDKDISVCRELKKIKPDIFANGGDRKANNIPEYELCEELGIKMIFNVGGKKIRSSSEIVKKTK